MTPPAGGSVGKDASIASETAAPVVTGIVAVSAARVTAAAVVGIYDVTIAPASICAAVTVPLTVTVNVPAAGVNASFPRAGKFPAPTSEPENAPDSVTVPLP